MLTPLDLCVQTLGLYGLNSTLALSLLTSVTWGNEVDNFFVPRFPHFRMNILSSIQLIGLL